MFGPLKPANSLLVSIAGEGDIAMTASIKTRVAKLEAKRRRDDEPLIVWRKPDGDIGKALEGVNFAPGDKVICPEWYGEGPMLRPRWRAGRLRFEVSKEEEESLERTLEKIVATNTRPAPIPHVADASRLSDADLWHICLAVQT
jgi:hypothetical protein